MNEQRINFRRLENYHRFFVSDVDKLKICDKISLRCFADVAHLVERHLAKVEVASSSLVIRSRI